MNNAGSATGALDRTNERFTVMNEQKRPPRLSFDIHSSSRIVDVGRTRLKKEEVMRSYSLLAGLLVLAGCSSNGDWTAGGVGDTTQAPKATGAVEQKSQFADATLLNLVDPGGTTIAITADGQPITVQVFYSGDKTTDSGRTASAPVLVDTINLDTDTTGKHVVNLNDPAFKGGYGSVFLDAVGVDPLTVFQTYVEYGSSIFSTGGSVFQGSAYRIPYLSGTLRVVLVVTNSGNVDTNVQFANLAHPDVTSVHLVPFSTYKFDTFGEGWNLNATSAIQITCDNGGTVSMSGYIDRFLQRQRIAPVKTSPFP
jgi:hypothetical protein